MQSELGTGQRVPTRPRPNPASNGKSPASPGRDRSDISVIGADVSISGDIHASEDLIIEGKVEGGVTCGTLAIGENGRVHGDIRTERLQLLGEVQGSISTQDLAIENTAKAHGDIEYSRLKVASGAIIHGRLSRHETATSDDAVARTDISRIRPVFEDPSYREAARTAEE